MRRWLFAFLLTGSVFMWAQHGGMHGGSTGGGNTGSGGMGSGSGNAGSGMGSGSGSGNMGPGMSSTHPMDMDSMPRMQQQPMTQKQMNSGSFQMLQQMSGMSGEQLQQMYTHSGAQDFKQFASAMVAANNLHLDMREVMKGLKTMNLTQTLKSMGVPGPDAKAEVKKAQQQVKQADKKKG